MSRWIELAIKERKVTIVLSLFILLFGVYAYYFIPKQENPDTSSPAAQIITLYPGATAADVEKLVTKPIEDVVATLDGIDYIKSYSNDNASVVVVMLNYDVVYEEQWDRLRNGIDDLAPTLPLGIQQPKIDTNMTESAGIILALSGQGYNYEQLYAFAEQYKEELDLLTGIKKVEIQGKLDKQLVVELNNEALLAYDLAIHEVFDLIRAHNLEIPSGAIQTPSGKISLTTPSGLSTIRDVENLIVYVSPRNGDIVRLKDISELAFEYDGNNQKYRNNCEPAIMITAYFKDDENVVLVGKALRRTLNQLKETLPSGLSIEEVLFLPEDVDGAISQFVMNLVQGILLVILVVLIGMGRRNAIIVSISIPLSMAITLIIMRLMQLEVQQVSIAALIIALGILVDNSIVIGDAIQVKLNEGIDHKQAALIGAREQAVPVLSSTLTTIAAFAPLMVLPGEAGEFAKTLPLVVMIALSASYLVAMLVTPALASKFFIQNDEQIDRLKSIKSTYQKLLIWNLNRPKRALGIVMLIFCLVLTGVLIIEIKMFPYVDKDLIYFNVTNEVSGDTEHNEAFIKTIEQMLLEEPEIVSVASAVGGGLPRFYMTADVMSPADNKGQLLSHFDLSKGQRFESREELAIYLQDKFDRALVGGYCTVNLLEINMPGPAVDVQLSGKNIDDVNRVADAVFEKLLSMNGTMDVQSDKTSYQYKYSLDIDENLASSYGLTKYDVQYQINLSLNGGEASVMKVDGNAYPIKVKSTIETIEDVMNLPIKSAYTNNKILVKQFADIKLKKQQSTIKRYNREALVSVSAKVKPEYGSGKIQQEIDSYLNNQVATQGVKISYGGDNETISKYMTGLISAGLIALVAVYIILLIQFNSLKQPIIILASIPLSFVGVIMALIVSGTHFTFTVGLGIASLFGIVVNNAILLIEYINRGRSEGLSIKAACEASVQQRMRPILLSSVTTIFGLVPLVLSKSSFFSPMAIALIGGLLISTVLTITVVPTIYYCMEGCKDAL